MKIWTAIKIFLIKGIKADLGINGEEEEDYDGSLPEGMSQAFLLNLFLVFVLDRGFNFTPEVRMWMVAGVFFYGFVIFFVFGLVKQAAGIEFPTGNAFYLPRKIRRT